MKLSIEQANKLLEQLVAGVTVVDDKDTTDEQPDIDSILRNIEACKAITEITKTSFGPNGM